MQTLLMTKLFRTFLVALSFGALSSMIQILPSSAQGRTYQCVRYKVRICVGQTISGDFMNGTGTVRQITDRMIQVDTAFFSIENLRSGTNFRVGPAPGSYQRSCQNFQMYGNTLVAECWTYKRRKLVKAILNVGNCPDDSDISNNNGVLVCRP